MSGLDVLNVKRERHAASSLGELPIINTPFTRLCETWMTNQRGPCGDFELDYIRCAERVGKHRIEKDCKNVLDDFIECNYQLKSNERYEAMQKERAKQGRPHKPAPPPDSLFVPVVPDH